MSTFAQQFAALIVPSQFDLLGETGVYDPAGAGAPRTITVIVTDVPPKTEEEEYLERSKEAIWVTTLRDAATGIDSPAIDDTLVLRGETTIPYSFQNEIANRTAGSWSLKFGRNRPEAYGPGGSGLLGEGR